MSSRHLRIMCEKLLTASQAALTHDEIKPSLSHEYANAAGSRYSELIIRIVNLDKFHSWRNGNNVLLDDLTPEQLRQMHADSSDVRMIMSEISACLEERMIVCLTLPDHTSE